MSKNPTNYNAMSGKPKEATYETKEEKLVENGNVVNDTPSYAAPVETDVEVEAPKSEAESRLPNMLGEVVNCLRLNIREKPNKDSAIVTVVVKGDTLVIDPNDSTDGWYCVGSGYVMKEFITIK